MNDNQFGVILENIDDKLDRLTEAMADVPAKVRNIDDRLKVVEADLKVVKNVVTDQSKELNKQAISIGSLKAS